MNLTHTQLRITNLYRQVDPVRRLALSCITSDVVHVLSAASLAGHTDVFGRTDIGSCARRMQLMTVLSPQTHVL